MRPAVKCSGGLTRCQRLAQLPRFVPACTAVKLRRPFHTSRTDFCDSKPPNNDVSGHDRSPSEQIDTDHDHQRQANENGEPGSEQQQHGRQSRPDAASTRPFGTRRKSLRQRRMTDIPRPPPIPDWFLKHNVHLDTRQQRVDPNPRNGILIRCVDTDSGHTLFTVPWFSAWPSVGGGPSTAKLQEDSTEDGGRRASRPEDHRSAGLPPDTAEHSLGSNFFNFTWESAQAEIGARNANRGSFHDASQGSSVMDVPRSFTSVPQLELPPDRSDHESKFNPLKWNFLEIESNARASMSMAGQSRLTIFPAQKADIFLYCHDSEAHSGMDDLVEDVATALQADMVRLDANDFAELTGDYVSSGVDGPGHFSSLAYDIFAGYQAQMDDARGLNEHGQESVDIAGDEMEEDEVDEDADEHSHLPDIHIKADFGNLGATLSHLESMKGDFSKLLEGLGARPVGGDAVRGMRRLDASVQPASNPSETRSIQWDDNRLGALLDSLLDSPKIKEARSDGASATTSPRGEDGAGLFNPKSYRNTLQELEKNAENFSLLGNYEEILRYWRREPGYWLPSVADTIVGCCDAASHKGDAKTGPHKVERPRLSFELVPADGMGTAREESITANRKSRLIVHVRDLRDICHSELGHAIVKRLQRVVQKRRRSGQQVLIIGTSAKPAPAVSFMKEHEDLLFRPIHVPAFFRFDAGAWEKYAKWHTAVPLKGLARPAYPRILEINLRHISSMLSRLRPGAVEDLLDCAPACMNLPGTSVLGEKVLSFDQVQRVVLTAIGLADCHARADVIKPVHVGLAASLFTRAETALRSFHDWTRWLGWAQKSDAGRPPRIVSTGEERDKRNGKSRLERFQKDCNTHESRLLSGVVDAQNIKATFADVHAPTETIDALKTLTTLSLLRPDAFKYGVLANDRLPGLLLYGPPGTGKTLLAKAVAKESQATVLEVSGAQVYEKYVGEGEKMVKAVFSLAKKLSPCVVFIDEADAIFGSRSGSSGNRNTHREVINQFLREWDGMDDHSVFMMVASNRPFDLDDAVLRRLPRRLLVDLPTANDREGILRIHLKDEEVAAEVEVSKLAARTPMYSGSDLKNLCVAAALAAVREENEVEAIGAHEVGGKQSEPRPKRILGQRHFERAMMEISASISEDMDSLKAIRKFDEQFGDGKGRKKKTLFGLGGSQDGIVDESAARVRQRGQARP